MLRLREEADLFLQIPRWEANSRGTIGYYEGTDTEKGVVVFMLEKKGLIIGETFISF